MLFRLLCLQMLVDKMMDAALPVGAVALLGSVRGRASCPPKKTKWFLYQRAVLLWYGRPKVTSYSLRHQSQHQLHVEGRARVVMHLVGAIGRFTSMIIVHAVMSCVEAVRITGNHFAYVNILVKVRLQGTISSNWIKPV